MIAVGIVCGRPRTLMTYSDRLRSLGTAGPCESCGDHACRAIVCMAGAGQQEDVDGLSVEEQLAIDASCIASDAASRGRVRVALKAAELDASIRDLIAFDRKARP